MSAELVQCPKCGGAGEFMIVQWSEISPGVVKKVRRSLGTCFCCKGLKRVTRAQADLARDVQRRRIQRQRDARAAQERRDADFQQELALAEQLAEGGTVRTES